MNVGDYVRTKDGITKIRNIKDEQFYNEYYEMGKMISYKETDTFVYYKDDDRRISIKDIIKSSPNIIDLIEVGDYVNGKEIEQIIDNELYFDTNDMAMKISFKNEDIKSIVTKEQFSSMEYKL